MNKHFLPEEREAARLFRAERLPEPQRDLLVNILEHFESAVTPNHSNRVLHEGESKGRTSLLETIAMAWKKIIPVGAVAILAMLAVVYKTSTVAPAPASHTLTTTLADGPLSVADVDMAGSELSADIDTEEGTDLDESTVISSGSDLYKDVTVDENTINNL